MVKKPNLVETINTYSFSIKELHERLSITGKYVGSGFYEGRSAEDIEKGISSDTNKYYIETKTPTPGITYIKNHIINKKTVIDEYIFTARVLKEILGIQGYIESFDKEKNKYIIKTTNKK